jgi:RNA polymerase sigma-70 factor (ECF subfamily)
VLSPLVDRAQQGDEDAFVALTQAVGDQCMAIAYRILRDAALAEDAVQTALTTAWRELPALRNRDRFEPWLHRTLVNICYAEAKRRRRASANVLALVPDVLQMPDATLTVHDRDQLERGFRRLSPEQRAVLVFHHYLGYTVAEVSDHLGIPLGTAKSRIRYATASLRAALEAGFEDGDARGDVWPDRHTFDLQVGSGGAVTFHDETVLTDDPCHITGTIPDVPDDVEGWLTGSGGSTVSAPGQISGAARSVTYWDIELGGNCFVGDPADLPSPGPGVWFCSRERHRVYDVDLGSDHLLVITWPDAYCGEGNDVVDKLNRLTDSLVASIR